MSNSSLGEVNFRGCEASNCLKTLGVKTFFQSIFYIFFDIILVVLICYLIQRLRHYLSLRRNSQFKEKLFLFLTFIFWILYSILIIVENLVDFICCTPYPYFLMISQAIIFVFHISIFIYCKQKLDYFTRNYNTDDEDINSLNCTMILCLIPFLLGVGEVIIYYFSHFHKSIGIVSIFVCLGVLILQIVALIKLSSELSTKITSRINLLNLPEYDRSEINNFSCKVSIACIFITVKLIWYAVNQIHFYLHLTTFLGHLREKGFHNGSLTGIVIDISENFLGICLIIFLLKGFYPPRTGHTD